MTDITNLDEVKEVSEFYCYQYYLVELGEEGKSNKKIVLVFPYYSKAQYPIRKTFSSDLLTKTIKESMRESFELFKALGGTRAITIRRPLKPIIEEALTTLKDNNNKYTVTKSEPLLVTEERT